MLLLHGSVFFATAVNSVANFIALLGSQHPVVAEQAVLALGNISSQVKLPKPRFGQIVVLKKNSEDSRGKNIPVFLSLNFLLLNFLMPEIVYYYLLTPTFFCLSSF